MFWHKDDGKVFVSSSFQAEISGCLGGLDMLQGDYTDALTYMNILLRQLDLCVPKLNTSFHLIKFLCSVHCKRNWNASLLIHYLHNQLNQVFR